MMLTGYNTNVPHKGRTLHVQTEDGGRGNPVVTTLLYERGAILDSVRSTYADIVIDDDCNTKVVAMMRDQHKRVIQAVMSGHYDEPAAEPVAAASAAVQDIDSVVAAYII
jgi:hypothetical protein